MGETGTRSFSRFGSPPDLANTAYVVTRHGKPGTHARCPVSIVDGRRPEAALDPQPVTVRARHRNWRRGRTALRATRRQRRRAQHLPLRWPVIGQASWRLWLEDCFEATGAARRRSTAPFRCSPARIWSRRCASLIIARGWRAGLIARQILLEERGVSSEGAAATGAERTGARPVPRTSPVG